MGWWLDEDMAWWRRLYHDVEWRGRRLGERWGGARGGGASRLQLLRAHLAAVSSTSAPMEGFCSASSSADSTKKAMTASVGVGTTTCG
jgi:hypothetical protein